MLIRIPNSHGEKNVVNMDNDHFYPGTTQQQGSGALMSLLETDR